MYSWELLGIILGIIRNYKVHISLYLEAARTLTFIHFLPNRHLTSKKFQIRFMSTLIGCSVHIGFRFFFNLKSSFKLLIFFSRNTSFLEAAIN